MSAESLISFAKIRRDFLGLSGREQAIISIALTCGLVIGIFKLAQSTRLAFVAQSARLVVLESTAQQVGPLLVAYKDIERRKLAMEDRYKLIGKSEGVLSFLESLVKTKVGVVPILSDLTPRPFGDKFELMPYQIRFNTNDLKRVLSLLEELVNGDQRYLLTNLEFTPRANGQIEVIMEINSIGTEGSASESNLKKDT